MSKLNKLVTNYPVSLNEEEIENLSATLAPVVAACGGGGGGTGGKIYTGIGFVTVNNSTNQIGLTEAANTKLNQDIPTKVSDLSDSSNYQTVAGMNEYLTTANATTTYQTIEDMSAYYKKTETSSKSELDDEFSKYATVNQLVGEISNVTQTIDILQGTVDGKQDILTFGYDENDAISSINSHKLAGAGGVTGDYYSASNPSGFINSTQAETQILAKNYITSGVSELDNFYSKTDTSSKTELQTKFNSLLDYDVVTGNSAVLITTADANNTRTFTISLTATPTAADTVLNGQNGVDATLNGNVWNVGLSQSAYNAVNNVQNKLDTTEAAQTYQPKGNYVSSTDITDMATKTWVGTQGYLTQVPSEYITETELAGYNYATTALLDTISSKIEQDIPSIAGLATKTDLQNVSAGVDYVSGALTGYQITGDYIVTGDILTATNNKLTGIKIGNTDYTIPTTDLTNYYTKSETSGATELSTEFGKYALKSEIPTVPTKVSDLTDSANYYKTTETSGKNELSTEFAKYLTTAQYNTDSATFALKSDLNGLVNSASVTTNDNYVMTNTGWKVLTLPGGGMTQVIHDDTLTGQGNADNSKLGLSQTAYNAITSVSSKLDTTAFSNVSGTFLTKSSADNDYAPLSVTADVNTLTAASAGWNNKVDKPTSLNDKYLVLRTDSNGAVSGWEDLKNECYSKTEATGTFIHRGMLDNDTGGTLSGTGLTGGSILGVNTNVIQTKLTNEQLSAISSVSGKQDALTQAQLSAISSVSSKLDTSALTINTATNDITLATGPSTSASISAVNYKRNYSEALLVPQRIVVATSDDDIVQHINYYSDGQYGTIIFVTSAHTN